jgi:hypothetical protein
MQETHKPGGEEILRQMQQPNYEKKVELCYRSPDWVKFEKICPQIDKI